MTSQQVSVSTSFHPSPLLSRFKNRPPLGFDELQGEADQTIQLHQGATLEYPIK